jgi:hypothetical protein
MYKKITGYLRLLLLCTNLAFAGQEDSVNISIDWNNIAGVSKTHISILACVEPPMRRGNPIHDKLFTALHDLKANYPRFQLWAPYPRLAVAELYPPSDGVTSWDFKLIDALVADFMESTKGHPVIFNIGTIPAWMLNSKDPISISENPDEADWNYGFFSDVQINATTLKLVAEYQARLASWYTNGGFTDEYGKWHASGHHYKIDYWEVLNEPDLEHGLSPADYTRLYDVIVEAVKKVSPSMKFIGPALSGASKHPEYFTYFLDRNHHEPGIPIDMVSYHFYSTPVSDESLDVMQHTIFEQADHFLTVVRYVDAIRAKLSPNTKTAVDELGSMLSPMMPAKPMPIAKSYWNMAGAMWAYVYANLALMGVDILHASELIDYPGQIVSTTLVDWTTGDPNARYWVLKLLRDNFGPGDQMIEPTKVNEAFQPDPAATIYRQGFISPQGKRKLLIINKRNKPVQITVSDVIGGYKQLVDESTVATPEKQKITQDNFLLPAFAVMVIGYP